MKLLPILALLLPGVVFSQTAPSGLALASIGTVNTLTWKAGSGAAGSSGCNIYVAASAAAVSALKAAGTPTFNGSICLPSMSSYSFPATLGSFAAMDEWSCPASGCALSALTSIVQAPAATSFTFSAIDQMTGCTLSPVAPVIGQPYTIKCTGITQTVTPQ